MGTFSCYTSFWLLLTYFGESQQCSSRAWKIDRPFSHQLTNFSSETDIPFFREYITFVHLWKEQCWMNLSNASSEDELIKANYLSNLLTYFWMIWSLQSSRWSVIFLHSFKIFSNEIVSTGCMGFQIFAASKISFQVDWSDWYS